MIDLPALPVSALIDALPDAILLVHEGLILLANTQAEWLLGCAKAAIVGQPLNDFIPVRFRMMHDRHVRTFISQPSVRIMGRGGLVLQRSGTEVPVDIALAALMTESGPLVVAALRHKILPAEPMLTAGEPL